MEYVRNVIFEDIVTRIERDDRLYTAVCEEHGITRRFSTLHLVKKEARVRIWCPKCLKEISERMLTKEVKAENLRKNMVYCGYFNKFFTPIGIILEVQYQNGMVRVILEAITSDQKELLLSKNNSIRILNGIR